MSAEDRKEGGTVSGRAGNEPRLQVLSLAFSTALQLPVLAGGPFSLGPHLGLWKLRHTLFCSLYLTFSTTVTINDSSHRKLGISFHPACKEPWGWDGCGGSLQETQHFGRWRREDYLIPGVGYQPRQHDETPISTKKKYEN